MSPLKKAALRAVFHLPLPLRRHVLYLRNQGRVGNFRRPRYFTEKINRRIIKDRRPLLAWTCDKLLVKDEAQRHGLAAPRTLWSGTDVAELAHRPLPDRWVLKPNHRSALVHFGAGSAPDADQLRAITAGWLESLQGEDLGEWAYTQARPMLLVEEMLGDGTKAPSDFRFFTFDGVVRCVQYESDAHGDHTRRFYTPEWGPLDVRQVFPLAAPVPKPKNYEQMLQAAAAIGAPFDFVRVDLYNIDGDIYLGEVTPYPTGGLMPFEPRSFDLDSARTGGCPRSE